jgi:hypothetical protein
MEPVYHRRLPSDGIVSGAFCFSLFVEQNSGADASRERFVIASQWVRPEVAGPMTG